VPFTIYTLKDPRTGAIRYVGATKLPLFLRLEHHMNDIYSDGKVSPRVQWLRDLAGNGLKAEIEAVATVNTVDPREAGDQEQLWIEHFREQGCDLLNVRRGGRWTLSPRGTITAGTGHAWCRAGHRGCQA